MSKHIQIIFTDIQPEQQEWVIAHLAEAGYDGFEESADQLKAYVGEESFDRTYLRDLAYKYQLSYSTEIISEQNWNQAWESDFHPVVVGDFAAIRADFHAPIPNVNYDIIITPKMSFGTGHHATTLMMVEQMQKLDFFHKSVLDFGTGTGVLAILAEKMGALNITAIDLDEWSIRNAAENIERNDCTHIHLHQANSLEEDGAYDIILANINRNVILAYLPVLKKALGRGGQLLLSGLLTSDREAIVEACSKESPVMQTASERNNWISLLFINGI